MRETHELIATQVGKRFKELRGQMTQAEYAGLLGLTQSQYNRYETGKRLPPDRIIEAAAKHAGISCREMIWGGGGDSPYGGSAGEASNLRKVLSDLLDVLDEEGRMDLYLFLKAKLHHLDAARLKKSQRAREALAALLRHIA